MSLAQIRARLAAWWLSLTSPWRSSAEIEEAERGEGWHEILNQVAAERRRMRGLSL